ncbi:MAG: CTP synthase [Chloroflexota bacterium]|nr:CTP synthase [Chloroflexota bacterium]MDE2941358.1 CTP synthase [Chloroflexota bacterium]MDE3267457.1 CTP synthase [Chloroflexota bacterium]
MTRYVFVTGGVVSSVGKGIAVASIGRILKSRGISVSVQKLDPYLNVDPGTMSPYQHGEVFVTDDGSETDLDLGHYERFIDVRLTSSSNVTAGQIYSSVIARERRGEFLGGTIQSVPHVTNEIKACMKKLADETQAEVVVVEVGGTVGDIEGQPFLEAIRQMRNDVGRGNVFYIHVTFLPFISSTGELKTKPTQHSVKELRSTGIQPDAIICRSDHEVSDDITGKISLFCDVPQERVVPLATVANVYEVPMILEEAGLADQILGSLGVTSLGGDMTDWRDMVERMKNLNSPLPIAVVGKYVDLPDSYISVREALRHAGLHHGRDVEVSWVNSEDIERDGPEEYLASVSGIVVPGGFGPRGIEGMIVAARYAREHRVPYLGLCLGMQLMVVEMARFVLGAADANSTEFDEDTPNPVIDLMPDQRAIRHMGGTMRLGVYPCQLVEGTRAAKAFGVSEVKERHRHRFEFNNSFREMLQEGGLIASGLSPDGSLVEVSEIVDHPFMVGVQFHPEFLSRPTRPHPLFREFIGTAKSVLREGAQPPLPMFSRQAES